ncbi:MAG: Uma2 family endonuclease [Phycisphaerae bacterium]
MAGAPVARRLIRRTCVGPRDHGRRMSLARFAQAHAAPGYGYELEGGVIVVVDVPGLPYAQIVRTIRLAIELHMAEHLPPFCFVAGGSEVVIRIPRLQAERHPDLAIYLTRPPTDADQPWDDWTPEIVIEVVSSSSRTRGYRVKSVDYLAVGVREYWIVDPLTSSATILTRRGDLWRKRKLSRGGSIRTALLPEFSLALERVFASARRRRRSSNGA